MILVDKSGMVLILDFLECDLGGGGYSFLLCLWCWVDCGSLCLWNGGDAGQYPWANMFI